MLHPFCNQNGREGGQCIEISETRLDTGYVLELDCLTGTKAHGTVNPFVRALTRRELCWKGKVGGALSPPGQPSHVEVHAIK